MNFGIREKWMTAHLAIGGMVLLFMVIYLRSSLVSFFEERFENRWKRELQLAKTYLDAVDFKNLTIREMDYWADDVGGILNVRVTVIDKQGFVVGDSRIELSEIATIENHKGRPEVAQALSSGFGKSRRFSTTVNLDLIYLALPIGNINDPEGVVRIAVDVMEVNELISQVHKLVWFAGGLGFAMVIVIGLFTSKSTASRINVMAKVAKRFAEGDFGLKIKKDSNDELGILGDALNKMADKLKENFGQITRERDQLHTILDGMVEGVVVTDLSGKIILSNRSFMNIFDFNEPVVHKSTREVFRNTQLLNALERAIVESHEIVETVDLVSPVRKNLEAHIARLGPESKPSGAVLVFHDVTQLKQLEEIRRDFVANVSHELRTPLTAIKGYAETLLENGSLSQRKSKEFLKTINKHTDRMTKLVEDLLTLSKIESMGYERELETINLADIMQNVLERFRNIFEKKKISLKQNNPKRVPLTQGIASELEIVIENLIDNAIKYGQQGKQITVTVEDLDSSVRVAIADKGIGIPIQDQDRIFERFYRVDKGRSRDLGGTGLGLSIVKHIVQRHGGQIWVKSKLGQGSEFIFTLPVVK